MRKKAAEMALNVPADSYVGVADADRYHQMRQSAAAWAALDEPTKERMLVSASDYLDANFRLKNGLNAAMRSGEKPVHPQVLKAVCELALQQQLNSNENPPVIPPAVTHVWAWFFELNRARQSGVSLSPLSWGEIDAYCRLTGQRMQRWELNLLAIFDTAFLDVMQKEEPEVKEGLDNAETDV